LNLVTLLAEQTGRHFNIIPLTRYQLSMAMHDTMAEKTTTNRIPILVGCTIPSLFPPTSESHLIRTEGAAVQLSANEESLPAFLKLLQG